MVAIQVLSNLVNFRSFGFTKIVPRIPEDKFAAIVEKSANAANAVPLWNELKDHIYWLICDANDKTNLLALLWSTLEADQYVKSHETNG